jgi:hypothetical protein
MKESSRPSNSRLVLSEQSAIEIYKHKLSLQERHTAHHGIFTPKLSLRGQSVFVSTMFDVSPKTVRDIWNRRTWQRATFQLWENEDVEAIEVRTRSHIIGATMNQVLSFDTTRPFF